MDATPTSPRIPAPQEAEAQKTRADIRRGLAAAFPVTLGVVPAALVLGAEAAQKGFSVAQVPLLTGLNFAGGSEFAAVELWTSPPYLLLIVAITFLVNSRHILMGAALAPHIQHLPRRIVYPMLFLMCDESWALGLTDAQQSRKDGNPRRFSVPFYFTISAVFYVTWVAFTTLGGVVGPVLGNVKAHGLDMAFPAIFLVLLRGQWKGLSAARPWFISLLVAASTYRLVPGAWYVAAGAIAGLAAAFLLADPSR